MLLLTKLVRFLRGHLFIFWMNEFVYIVEEVAEKYAEEFDMAPDIIQWDMKG